MSKNTNGGGAGSIINGISFEEKYNIENYINNSNEYYITNNYVFTNDTSSLHGILLSKHELYKWLKLKYNIDHKSRISKRLLPDEAYLTNDTLYIFEKKIQQRHGSVDEKLQTCDFKLKQYQKLLSGTNIKVEYCYILSEWFVQEIYTDVLDYIESVGCTYIFEDIPLEMLGIKRKIDIH